MPGYDNPITSMYNYPNMDFGASSGATTHWLAGPAGKKGRLIEVGVVLTEATIFATTLGTIEVGKDGNLDEYAKLNIPTAKAVKLTINSKDDTDAIILADIPADTSVCVTLTEGTGAGLTGQGYPYIIVDWY